MKKKVQNVMRTLLKSHKNLYLYVYWKVRKSFRSFLEKFPVSDELKKLCYMAYIDGQAPSKLIYYEIYWKITHLEIKDLINKKTQIENTESDHK